MISILSLQILLLNASILSKRLKCWYMGFITLALSDTRDKLNAPQFFRRSYLTPDHWETRGHFHSAPDIKPNMTTRLTSVHEDTFPASEDDFFLGTWAAWKSTESSEGEVYKTSERTISKKKKKKNFTFFWPSRADSVTVLTAHSNWGLTLKTICFDFLDCCSDRIKSMKTLIVVFTVYCAGSLLQVPAARRLKSQHITGFHTLKTFLLSYKQPWV